MSILALDTLRSRVAASVEALASPAAWTESPFIYDVFPQDPQRFGHLRFAVGLVETLPLSDKESYRGTPGALVTTTVGVRWTYQLKINDYVASYGAALAAESVLLVGLIGTSNVGLHLAYARSRRNVVGDGAWFLGEVLLSAQHRVALT